MNTEHFDIIHRMIDERTEALHQLNFDTPRGSRASQIEKWDKLRTERRVLEEVLDQLYRLEDLEQ